MLGTLNGNENFKNAKRSGLKMFIFKSYECQMESNGKQIPAVQHCWITKNNANYSVENRFVVDGILGTAVYQ